MKFTKEKFLKVISESYSEIDEMGRMADKKETDVKQKPLFDKDGITQIGVLMRSNPLDMNSPWNPAYFLCGEPLETFKEKHGEAIQKALAKYKFREGDVIFNSGVCPLGTDDPVTGEKAKDRRPWERFKESVLKKQGVVVTDFYGNVLSMEQIKQRQYVPPRGTMSFAVYVNGELYAQFGYDASTPKKQIDIQQEAADKFVAELKQQYPDLSIKIKNQKTTKASQETISRKLLPILRDEFSVEQPKGKAFAEILNDRSIPALLIGDNRYEDRYQPIWSNSKISYRALGFNMYQSSDQFLEMVFARAMNEETPEMHTSHLARVFAPEKTWDPSKPTEKKWVSMSGDPDYEPYYHRVGNYNVNVFGLREGNWDVAMMMEFEFKGERIGDTFIWTIGIQNKFGRKRPDEYKVSKFTSIKLSEDSLLDNKVVVSESVQLPPNATFNESNTIMDNEAVVSGLFKVINDFKEKIISIDPMSMLEVATIQRSDIERIDESIDKMIKQSILEFYKSI